MFQNKVGSKASTTALKHFFATNYDDVKEELIIEAQQILLSLKFEVLENCSFSAMCGFRKTVYVNNDILFENEDMMKSRFVSLGFHEGAHEIIRIMKDDVGEITPREKEEQKSLEAGFRLERILFGPYNLRYWYDYVTLTDDKCWENENIPLIKKNEFEKRSVSNYCRSGCEDLVFCQEM
jgi:hypothetical protein